MLRRGSHRRSEGVGRLGLEPRTHGLKEDRCTSPNALPALMARENARKTQVALAVPRCSFHDSFHGSQARAAELRHRA
jgi:hypothetical protein